ncbi:MAG: T9SS type A sorting domain-containing protein [Lewinellaceae bacterium]|nr:T9SS type A sorting domain-containing protein [Lewinellaceae bacterium]
MTPGPSYEAHLNVFNCPVEYEAQNRNAGAFSATASVFPNPATDQLWVTIPEAGNGEWQLLSADGKLHKAGNWQAANQFSMPVSDLARGIYFLQLTHAGYATETIRFVKVE